MTDMEKIIKGLTEISEYVRAKADIAGIGKGKEVFDSWYRAVEDALALLREQEKTKVVFRQYDGSVESECGNCGLYLDKAYSVCPKCGKELDWNDT